MFGKYLILRLLAKGGASEVYEAVHLGLKKHVALKVLRAEFATNSYSPQEFIREGENAARIRHPHIVDVTDLGVVDQVPYLVMELLQGQDLATVFADRGPLPAETLVDIILPVAAAVAAGHIQGVIHGDLKPANIFLHQEGRRAVPKLLDFGLSRRMHERRHPSGSQLFGTPHYMAPEQARGASPADSRTDQYAIGVVLYEGVTGRLPHDHNDIPELLRRIATEGYPRASELADLPPGFDDLLDRVLAPERAGRFPTVAELALALCPYASGPVGAFWASELGAEGFDFAAARDLPARVSTPRSLGLPPPPPMGRIPGRETVASSEQVEHGAPGHSHADVPVQAATTSQRTAAPATSGRRRRLLLFGGVATAALAVTGVLVQNQAETTVRGAPISATTSTSDEALPTSGPGPTSGPTAGRADTAAPVARPQSASATSAESETQQVSNTEPPVRSVTTDEADNRSAVGPAVDPNTSRARGGAEQADSSRAQARGGAPADGSRAHPQSPDAEPGRVRPGPSAERDVRPNPRDARAKARSRKEAPALGSRPLESPPAAAISHHSQPQIQAIVDEEPTIELLGIE